MAQREDPPALFSIPQVPINFVPAQAGDTFKIGVMTIRVMEDGSHTGNSLPSTPFPPYHPESSFSTSTQTTASAPSN